MKPDVAKLANSNGLASEGGVKRGAPAPAAQHRPRRATGWWGMTAVMVLLAAIMTSGLLAARGYFSLSHRAEALIDPNARTDKGTDLAPNRNLAATARITLAPNHDEKCRELLLNNHTGEMTDAGVAPCPSYRASTEEEIARKRYTSGRIDKIREGFSKR